MANPLLLLHHTSFSTAASKMSVAVLSASLLLIVLIPMASCSHAQDSTKDSVEIGQRAPDFELPVVGENRFLNLRDEYRQGPVVVIVLRGYPGYQCPLCKSQFNAVVNRARPGSRNRACCSGLSGQDRAACKTGRTVSWFKKITGPNHIGSMTICKW